MRRVPCAFVAVAVAISAFIVRAPAADANHGANFFNVPWQFNSTARFNVPFYINNAFPTGAARERVRNGFQRWNGLNQNLLWVEPGTIGPYDVKNPCGQPYQRNGVFWGTEDGPGGIAANTWSCRATNGTMWVAGINFDSTEDWYTGTGTPGTNQVDMWSVASHETGHMGGFIGHWDPAATICIQGSGQPYHTMCPVVPRGTTFVRTLETHEITAFQAR